MIQPDRSGRALTDSHTCRIECCGDERPGGQVVLLRKQCIRTAPRLGLDLDKVISGRLRAGQCVGAARDFIPVGIQEEDQWDESAGRRRGRQGEFIQLIQRERPPFIAKGIHIA